MEWMLMPYKKYAQFSGRSRRKEYWMFFLLMIIVNIVVNILVSVSATLGTVVSLVFFLGSIVPGIAVAIRRAHDVDKSGWFMLIPIYNLILALTDGTKGSNRFGPDPKGTETVEAFS